jgi:L,D-transpeptidase catalytic domain
MYGNWTVGSKIVRGASAFKVLAVLGLGTMMLGAHYRERRGSLTQAPVPEVLPAAILEGAGTTAATVQEWSPARTFRLVALAQWGRFAALDSAERLTILKLNRVDLAHARRRDLVVPDTLLPELEYAPFPAQVRELVEIPKFIAVSRRVQAFAAYEYGRLVRWGPTSTGKATTPTDSGLFFTNWKSRTAISTDDPSWILDWYVNIIALKGVAFHQYELPGKPASHGCVRLLEQDARWMYGWAEQWVPGRGSHVKVYGTPVLIFGDYAYRQPAPWLGLTTDDPAATVSPAELNEALSPNLTIVAERAGPSGETEKWRAFLALASLSTRGS